MMIRGMSYKNGIFFLNNKGLSHATFKDGEVLTHYFPLSPQAYYFLITRIILSVPLYLLVLGLILVLWIERPDFIFSTIPAAHYLPNMPLYSFILFLFSYHFLFPLQLKKYHGAEHKVFSYKGKKHLSCINDIAEADIVNRYCSTNAIVLFFTFFLLSIPFFNGWIATSIGWLAMVLIPRFWKWGDDHLFFPISAILQKTITTTQPDEAHLNVAILSYMSLQSERALTKEEVWNKFYQELELQRIAKEERERKAEMERISKLIMEQELNEVKVEHNRELLLFEYFTQLNEETHVFQKAEIKDVI